MTGPPKPIRKTPFTSGGIWIGMTPTKSWAGGSFQINGSAHCGDSETFRGKKVCSPTRGLRRVTPPCTNTRGQKVVSPGKNQRKDAALWGGTLGGFG